MTDASSDPTKHIPILYTRGTPQDLVPFVLLVEAGLEFSHIPVNGWTKSITPEFVNNGFGTNLPILSMASENLCGLEQIIASMDGQTSLASDYFANQSFYNELANAAYGVQWNFVGDPGTSIERGYSYIQTLRELVCKLDAITLLAKATSNDWIGAVSVCWNLVAIDDSYQDFPIRIYDKIMDGFDALRAIVDSISNRRSFASARGVGLGMIPKVMVGGDHFYPRHHLTPGYSAWTFQSNVRVVTDTAGRLVPRHEGQLASDCVAITEYTRDPRGPTYVNKPGGEEVTITYRLEPDAYRIVYVVPRSCSWSKDLAQALTLWPRMIHGRVQLCKLLSERGLDLNEALPKVNTIVIIE